MAMIKLVMESVLILNTVYY